MPDSLCEPAKPVNPDAASFCLYYWHLLPVNESGAARWGTHFCRACWLRLPRSGFGRDKAAKEGPSHSAALRGQLCTPGYAKRVRRLSPARAQALFGGYWAFSQGRYQRGGFSVEPGMPARPTEKPTLVTIPFS